MTVACEQLHVVFILDLWFLLYSVLLFLFFFNICVTLHREPELSLNRNVTVASYIIFTMCEQKFSRRWIPGSCNTEIFSTPAQNLMEIFYHPLYRKRDKEPRKHSRVCNCHFRDGKKSNGSEICEWNKLYSEQRGSPKKKMKKILKEKTLAELVEDSRRSEPISVQEGNVDKGKTTQEVILEAELYLAKRDVQDLQEQVKYKAKKLQNFNLHTFLPSLLLRCSVAAVCSAC